MKDAVTMAAWTKRQRVIRRRARKWAKKTLERLALIHAGCNE